jgi:hypothetical protein
MSPHLHANVYGFMQHSFGQTIRFGGWRPMVFFQHGLALALFMAAAALVAGWVWFAGPAEGRGRFGAAALLLVPTAVLTRSTGAIALGFLGGLVLWLSRAGGRVWLLALVAVPPAYAAARATGAWSGGELVEFAGEQIEADRAQSLEFRLTNENLLIRKALDRPAFGWGGWGRCRVYDDRGNDISVTDGLWVIAMGDRGLVGLVALGAAFLLPVARYALARPRAGGRTPLAAADACVLVLALWAIDSLFNAMLTPVYPLIAGGAAGLADAVRPAAPAAEDAP